MKSLLYFLFDVLLATVVVSCGGCGGFGAAGQVDLTVDGQRYRISSLPLSVEVATQATGAVQHKAEPATEPSG